jgi:Molecular chaperone (small heat shock protein)
VAPSTLSQRRISYPPVNISEGEEDIVVMSEIPGMDTGDIELTLNEKSLIIRGTKKNEVGNYYRQERPTGKFSADHQPECSCPGGRDQGVHEGRGAAGGSAQGQGSHPLTIAIDAQ